MLADKKVEASVKAILRNPKHPQFSSLWARLADRGYGSAPQKYELTGKDGAPLPATGVAVTFVKSV